MSPSSAPERRRQSFGAVRGRRFPAWWHNIEDRGIPEGTWEQLWLPLYVALRPGSLPNRRALGRFAPLPIVGCRGRGNDAARGNIRPPISSATWLAYRRSIFGPPPWPRRQVVNDLIPSHPQQSGR